MSNKNQSESEEITVKEDRLDKLLEYLEDQTGEITCPCQSLNTDIEEVPWCCEDWCVWSGDECIKRWLKGEKG